MINCEGDEVSRRANMEQVSVPSGPVFARAERIEHVAAIKREAYATDRAGETSQACHGGYGAVWEDIGHSAVEIRRPRLVGRPCQSDKKHRDPYVHRRNDPYGQDAQGA